MTPGDGCHTWTVGLMTVLQQSWRDMEKGGCSSGVLSLGSHLPSCPCVPLGLCGWASDGQMAPVMGLGGARQDIIWYPPPAIVSLNSFVGMQMKFIA